MRSRFPTLLFSAVPVLVLLLLWWWITSCGKVDAIILPRPAAVLAAFGSLAGEQLLPDLLHTLGRALAALSIAIVIGVPVGLWLGLHGRVYRAVEGIVHALRSVPAAALFPLFLVAIGVGESSIVALASFNSLMVVLVATVNGTLLANESRLYHARLLGLRGWAITSEVLFWEALPHILGGIRIALGYCLALVIAVEMFIGVSHMGLGRRIYEFQAAYRTPETYALIIVASSLGIAMNLLLDWIERATLRWHPDSKADLS
ncbi:NitT/TauT family transport system permease protein/sulfonate transport system permease protein [Roseimicrobium gellanilyticum]|uniref:NitT/TauT family transport system permease protein/sulfonate transport system permease protein n=1 Tax=Roseimicrobium gellanilyticum TaxID=748857 RepID=A0A366H4Q2_9BACT|nr:ABC transporter permease subunit [Roseimicrobium gellanilyticum]RBP36888.1 NitT/TauT family transport system permease protein/sulfonate transport system permease protein [Roseimicrobium gellanilyticum]